MFTFVRTLQNGYWRPLAQLQELIDFPETKFVKIEPFDIELFAKNLKSNLFIRLRRIVCVRGVRYRRSLTDEVKIRFGIIFLKAIYRKGSM